MNRSDSLRRATFRGGRPCLVGIAFGLLARGATCFAGPDVPDFDLAISCDRRIDGAPRATLSFVASVTLSTRESPGGDGAQGWTLSISGAGGVRIVDAMTDGTEGAPAPNGLRDDGFEKTELTSGPGNEGAVSAVVLSLTMPVTLAADGSATLLIVEGEVDVPETGCVDAAVVFRDGLRGAGEPVRNDITWRATTRADDGGERTSPLGALDNDRDAAEDCEFRVCSGASAAGFVRGNCDSTRGVELTDAIVALDFLFRGGVTPACLSACDVDDSGALDVTDAIVLLSHLYLGGPPPRAPFPACGADPTPDGLSCKARPSCD